MNRPSKLIPLVYGELRLRARRLMGRERAGHSLRPTALIHEAYLCASWAPIPWTCAIAAISMRSPHA
jgi:RNA polymerase sigma-70 factor, ECF subfamily